MNITCIFPQKRLESPYLDAVREYEKRLSRYCKIKFLSAASLRQIPASAQLLTITSGNAKAAMLSSEAFAEQISHYGLCGQAQLCFALTNVPEYAESCLSLSHAKLSDSLLAVVLAEQLYRAFRIIHNHSYHK